MQSISSDPLARHEKYEKLQMLGQGSFGFVIMARNKLTGKSAAIKVWG
jgi:serine/threonine protein kinase